jgi:hypothetical protein
LKFSEYKKVPVVVLNGNIQLNDSSFIISALESVMNEREGKKKSVEYFEKELKWRKYVDDTFVHTLPRSFLRFFFTSFSKHLSFYGRSIGSI